MAPPDGMLNAVSTSFTPMCLCVGEEATQEMRTKEEDRVLFEIKVWHS